jgi:hypothetical protein
MNKTLLATALLGLFASHQALARDETQELRKVIEQQQVLQDLEKRLEETGSSKSATTIGGYGELHYNISDNIKGKDKKEFDFHRFVLFVGHEFTDKPRFLSELEVEHALASEGKKGEVEIEQAYIEHDFNQSFTGKAGLFLMPVGIINETHDPFAFYGVERNPVGADIIPATWWEAGLGLNIKAVPGLAFDTAVTGGLTVVTRVTSI